MSEDRFWLGDRWVYPTEVNEALDATRLAIDEYYNGDRNWAITWLLNAMEANAKTKKDD